MTDLTDLADQIRAETQVARGRMLARAEEVERAIAKHGDHGGHWARMVAALRSSPEDTR